MSWGYVAVGVGTLVGGYLSGEGQKDAAETAANAQGGAAGAGVAEQRRQFNAISELLKPYTSASTSTGNPVFRRDMIDTSGDFRPNEELYNNSPEYRNAWDQFIERHQATYGVAPNVSRGTSISAVQQQIKDLGFDLDSYNAQQQNRRVRGSLGEQQAMLGLSGPDAERAAIGRIEQSQGFQSAVQQGENAMLQNASATGGLRGGNMQAALAQFRPRLLASAIEDQYSKLSGLTSIGQNAAVGVGNAGMQTGNNVTNLLQQQGAALAGNALARGQVNSNQAGMLGQLGGAYLGYQQFGRTAQPVNTTQWGTAPGSQQTQMLQAQEAGF